MKIGDKFTAYLVYETEQEEVGELPPAVEVTYLGAVSDFDDDALDDAAMDDFATHVFGSESSNFEVVGSAKVLGVYVRGWHKAVGDREHVWRESAYGGYRATYVLVPKSGGAA